MGGLDDDRGAAGSIGHERGPVEHDPAPLAREHACQRDLAWSILVLGGPQRAAGHGQHGGRQLALGLPVAVG
jgi:hypothetical protein